MNQFDATSERIAVARRVFDAPAARVCQSLEQTVEFSVGFDRAAVDYSASTVDFMVPGMNGLFQARIQPIDAASSAVIVEAPIDTDAAGVCDRLFRELQDQLSATTLAASPEALARDRFVRNLFADNNGPRSPWVILALIVDGMFLILGLTMFGRNPETDELGFDTFALVALFVVGLSAVAVCSTGRKRQQSGRILALLSVVLAVLVLVIYLVAIVTAALR